MIRLGALFGVAAVTLAAFLGGHAAAGGQDGDTARATPQVMQLPKAPKAIAGAAGAVALPVLAVRQLPTLAAPHIRRAPVRSTPTRSPSNNTQQQQQQQQQQQNVTPAPPPSTPNNGGGGNGGGNNGGYFDNSG